MDGSHPEEWCVRGCFYPSLEVFGGACYCVFMSWPGLWLDALVESFPAMAVHCIATGIHDGLPF